MGQLSTAAGWGCRSNAHRERLLAPLLRNDCACFPQNASAERSKGRTRAFEAEIYPLKHHVSASFQMGVLIESTLSSGVRLSSVPFPELPFKLNCARYHRHRHPPLCTSGGPVRSNRKVCSNSYHRSKFLSAESCEEPDDLSII